MMRHRASESRFVRAAGLGLLLAGLLVGATWSEQARAQRRDDGATAETLGMGDAVRASAWGPSALYFNPAGLLKIPAMLMQANYTYLEGQGGHAFTAGVVDGQTSEFAALGLAYSYVTAERGGYKRSGHQFRAGLGTGYRAGEVGIFAGVGARYLDMSFRPSNDSLPVFPDGDVNAWTVDVGLTFDFADRIRFGVVGQNLLDTGHNEALRLLGVGLSFVFATLEVAASMDIDISGRLDQTITNYSFGADYGFAQMFRVRLGLVVDTVWNEERVSTGLGWSSPNLAVDVGWSTSVAEPANMLLGFTFRYLPGF